MASRPGDLQGGYDNAGTSRAERTVQTGTPADVDGNGTAIASMIIGFLAATLAFTLLAAPAAILFGLIAAVLGFMGLGKANRFNGLHKGLAISGIVSGLLGLLAGIAVIAGALNLADRVRDEINTNPQLQESIQDAQEGVSEQVSEATGG
jgi:uncharacterized membrane protein required for colicin V production